MSSDDVVTEAWILDQPDVDDVILDFVSSSVNAYRTMPAMRYYSIDRGAFSITSTMLVMDFTAEGVTSARLKMICQAAGLASEGRVAAMLAYMRSRGHLVARDAEGNRRTRRLSLSPEMLAYYRARITSGTLPFIRYSPVLQTVIDRLADPRFFMNYIMLFARKTAERYNIQSEDTPIVTFFAERHAGMYILYDLIAADPGALRGAAIGVSVQNLSSRLGVSRPHVLKLLTEAAEASHLAWNREDRQLAFSPRLARAVRRLIAGIGAFQISGAIEAQGLWPD